jgi:hypothetical protein
MSLRNTRPGIWLTFRCYRCQQLKFIANAGHYKNLNDMIGVARDRGWFIPATNLCYCPACSPAARSAYARRKIVLKFEGETLRLK